MFNVIYYLMNRFTENILYTNLLYYPYGSFVMQPAEVRLSTVTV